MKTEGERGVLGAGVFTVNIGLFLVTWTGVCNGVVVSSGVFDSSVLTHGWLCTLTVFLFLITFFSVVM